MVTENASGGTETVTVTNTVTSSGGGSTVYKSLNIIVPGAIEMGLKDEVVVPINLRNPEASQSLNGINLSAVPNTKDISIIFDRTKIKKLSPKMNETVFLFLSSHSEPGEYDVDIRADVDNPRFREEAKLYVKLVENVGKTVIEERIVFVEDLFREHPECLELNDLLIEASKMLDSDVEGAKEMIESVIVRCRDLVSSEEEVGLLGRVREWKNPVMIVLVFLVLVLVIVLLIRKPKFNLYQKGGENRGGKKSKSKKWFSFGGKSKKGKKKSWFKSKKKKVIKKKDVWGS